MGQQGSRAPGSGERAALPEAGRRDFEAFQRLLSSASASHQRALEAHRDFLEECCSLQDGLASLEARVLKNLESLGGAHVGTSSSEALAVKNHQVENHQGCLRAAAEACGPQTAEVPHGAVLEARAPVKPAPACEDSRRGVVVHWAKEVQCDDSAGTRDDTASPNGTPQRPPCCKGRPQPAPLRESHGSGGSVGLSGAVAWPEWSGASPPTSTKSYSTRTPTSLTRRRAAPESLMSASPSLRNGELTREPGCCQGMVMLPTSHKRTAWDMMSIVILGYDCIMIPLSVFGVGNSSSFWFVETFITLFWSIDIVMSFLSAYYTLGGIETRPSKIAWRYIRSNFMFDLTLVLVDLMLNVSKILEGDAVRLMRMGKVIRFGKVFRLLRLLRIMKMPKAFEGITDAMQSKTFSTFIGIAQAVCLIAVVNHFIACMWYAVSANTSTEWDMPAWIHESGMANRSTAYLYFTALHWSITQFTPSSMEVQPKNVPERIYAIVVVFVALMVFSSFVSGITSAMTSLREYNNYKYSQLENLRRYILSKRISLDLSNRIGEFIKAHNFMAKKRIIESDVDVFSVLPTSMKYQLRWEAHHEIISAHHFFFQISEHVPQALLDICYKAITEVLYDLARDVFSPGSDASDMLFLLGGIVDYFKGSQLEAQPVQFTSECGPSVFCELALWIRFAHSSRLSCKTASEFLVLSSGSFRGCIIQYAELHDACCVYARELMSVLEADDEPRDWDVLQKFDDLQAIAQSAFDSAFQPPDNIDGSEKRMAFAVTSQTHRKIDKRSASSGSFSSA